MFPLKPLKLFGLPLQVLLDLSRLALNLVGEGLCIAESTNDVLFLSLEARDFIAHLLIKFTFVPEFILEVAIYSLFQRGCLLKFTLEFFGLTFLVGHTKADGSFFVGSTLQLRENHV